VSFEIIMTTSVTRSCFTNQHQTCKTQDRFFLVSDRSCPKTDGLRPHHCPLPVFASSQFHGEWRFTYYPFYGLLASESQRRSFPFRSLLKWMQKRWGPWRCLFLLVDGGKSIRLVKLRHQSRLLLGKVGNRPANGARFTWKMTVKTL